MAAYVLDETDLARVAPQVDPASYTQHRADYGTVIGSSSLNLIGTATKIPAAPDNTVFPAVH